MTTFSPIQTEQYSIIVHVCTERRLPPARTTVQKNRRSYVLVFVVFAPQRICGVYTFIDGVGFIGSLSLTNCARSLKAREASLKKKHTQTALDIRSKRNFFFFKMKKHVSAIKGVSLKKKKRENKYIIRSWFPHELRDALPLRSNMEMTALLRRRYEIGFFFPIRFTPGEDFTRETNWRGNVINTGREITLNGRTMQHTSVCVCVDTNDEKKKKKGHV